MTTWVAEDRPVYELDETHVDRLAELVKEGGTKEKEIAELAFALNKHYTWRELHAELVKRNAYPPSYSWLFRLGKIWAWWVVKHNYDPSLIFSLPRNKLYLMASKRMGDLEWLLARAHLSDAVFAKELKEATNTPNSFVVLKISRPVYETLNMLSKRLNDLTGYQVSPAQAAEFAIEMAALLSDRAILEAWGAVHGEAAEP